MIAASVGALVGLLRWRVDVEGLDNVPEDGGAVLAFNHHSYVDWVMVGWAIVRRRGRPVRFLAKREMWESPWTRWFVRWGGAVPVDRSDADSRGRALDAAIRALERGELVAVAPEQTISRSFELLPLSTGAARMAQRAEVPIVPAIGWGSQRLATKGRPVRLAVGIPVMVRYGEPMRVDPEEDPAGATERLRSRMAALLDTLQRSYPDHPAPGDQWWQPARLGGSAPPHQDALEAHQRRVSRWRSTEQPTEPGTHGEQDGDE